MVQLDVMLDQRVDGFVVLRSADAGAGVLEDVGARVAVLGQKGMNEQSDRGGEMLACVLT